MKLKTGGKPLTFIRTTVSRKNPLSLGRTCRKKRIKLINQFRELGGCKLETELSIITKKSIHESFNRISVDGDTSTSDTVFVATTNKRNLELTKGKKEIAIEIFYNELKGSMIDLAKKIIIDGEGATKFITVRVKNAKDTYRARKICFSIANSLLVKTAIAGEDANWGRLVMAIGKTQIKVQTNKIKIYVQGILLCENGRGIDTVDEVTLSNSLKNKNIKILIDLAEGGKEFTSWTSDLTEEYIKINADYRS